MYHDNNELDIVGVFINPGNVLDNPNQVELLVIATARVHL